MNFIIATADFSPPEVLKLILASSIWAELVGVPVAWAKLRSTDEWANRPEGVRRIDLLSRYVGGVTALAGIWALAVALTALLVSGLS
jgi:hypothetical protein